MKCVQHIAFSIIRATNSVGILDQPFCPLVGLLFPLLGECLVQFSLQGPEGGHPFLGGSFTVFFCITLKKTFEVRLMWLEKNYGNH